MDKACLEDQQKAVIVGGGITGLTCAYYLNQLCPGLDIKILEKSDRPGGAIKSLNLDGLLIECGPESFSTRKSAVVDLAIQLGIADQIIQASMRNRRSFVCLNKRLIALPDGIMMYAPGNLFSFAFSRVISWIGKLRMSMDFIIPAAKGQEDESLHNFINRRLGQEAFAKLAEPMVSGILGADACKLSAQSTLPEMVALEKQYGSIMKGLLHTKTKLKFAGKKYEPAASFKSGMESLVISLLKSLPKKSLLTAKLVTGIKQDNGKSKYLINCSDQSSYEADYLILCTPAAGSARLLNDVNPALADKLKRIPPSASIIVNLAYERRFVEHPLNGFGFVVPRSENMLVSACSFSSIKFNGRSSEHLVLLRIFICSLMEFETKLMSENELLSQCHLEMRDILGIKQNPIFSLVTKHYEVIPQYLLGHQTLINEIAGLCKETYGLELAGNSYDGISLADCIKSAKQAANNVAAHEKKSLSGAG